MSLQGGSQQLQLRRSQPRLAVCCRCFLACPLCPADSKLCGARPAASFNPKLTPKTELHASASHCTRITAWPDQLATWVCGTVSTCISASGAARSRCHCWCRHSWMQPQWASQRHPRGPPLAPAISSSLPRLLLMLRETAGLLRLSALMLAPALCLHAGALGVSLCPLQCLLLHQPGFCISQAGAPPLLGVKMCSFLPPLWGRYLPIQCTPQGCFVPAIATPCSCCCGLSHP